MQFFKDENYQDSQTEESSRMPETGASPGARDSSLFLPREDIYELTGVDQ